jgi:S-adenosylmethionine:tRNA ribosyltransferase-isomerase
MLINVAPAGAVRPQRGADPAAPADLADFADPAAPADLADFADFADFVLPAEREAHDPPEARGLARDGVRLLVSRRASGEVSHHAFTDLPGLLLPGDLLVVNTTGTLPAQVRAGGGLAVHFSTAQPDGTWLVELRRLENKISMPNGHGHPGQVIPLPAGALLTLQGRATARLWRARLSVAVVPYLLRHGLPIRYSYVRRDWPLSFYQTVFAARPGSAEMPSASRPFTPEVVTALATRGVLIAPLTLHCGVSSLEAGEDPYPEPYDVPPATARLVNHVRASGGRVIAAGTTVVRALETAARADGRVLPAAGWTSHVVTPETGVRAVDGLLTGLHEPRSSHLRMLAAFAGPGLLARCYAEAIGAGYLWHEFGDVHLLIP